MSRRAARAKVRGARSKKSTPATPASRSTAHETDDVASIAPNLLAWFAAHGRHDLPWQKERTPYSVWVSEVMLQQTQVATVIPFYLRFMRRFPTVAALAAAPLDDVLGLWSGLGYYARGRNLWHAARAVAKQHGGHMPETFADLLALPGIGRSTAGAILAQARGVRLPILDGNVKRVLARYHAVDGWPGDHAVQSALWEHAERHTPHERVADYTQAIMDLGATLCTRARPACTVCPLATKCAACRNGTQAKYPAPRPRRARAHRRVTVLVVEDPDGRVLLERRPAKGVWGGLYSLPELPDGETSMQWCARELGTAVSAEHELATIEHAFTHFDLDLLPRLLRLAALPAVVNDRDDRFWHVPAAELQVGIPAPVTALLRALASGSARLRRERGPVAQRERVPRVRQYDAVTGWRSFDLTRMIHCVVLGAQAEGLDRLPYPGALGQRIYENVSKVAWQRWLKHQTMLINEYRLTPIEPKARKFLEDEMQKFFFGEGSERPPDYKPTQV